MKDEMLLLKDKRKDLEVLSELLKLRKQEFADNNKQLIDSLDKVKEEIGLVTTQIKDRAIEHYTETGEKDVGLGVKIKIFKTLQYDNTEALNWAKSHNLALSLDKKSFEKIAKADKLEMVEYIEEPRVAIPSKIELD